MTLWVTTRDENGLDDLSSPNFRICRALPHGKGAALPCLFLKQGTSTGPRC
jgi:hypothetical protein